MPLYLNIPVAWIFALTSFDRNHKTHVCRDAFWRLVILALLSLAAVAVDPVFAAENLPTGGDVAVGSVTIVTKATR